MASDWETLLYGLQSDARYLDQLRSPYTGAPLRRTRATTEKPGVVPATTTTLWISAIVSYDTPVVFNAFGFSDSFSHRQQSIPDDTDAYDFGVDMGILGYGQGFPPPPLPVTAPTEIATVEGPFSATGNTSATLYNAGFLDPGFYFATVSSFGFTPTIPEVTDFFSLVGVAEGGGARVALYFGALNESWPPNDIFPTLRPYGISVVNITGITGELGASGVDAGFTPTGFAVKFGTGAAFSVGFEGQEIDVSMTSGPATWAAIVAGFGRPGVSLA